jgi:hypothetical protein
MVKGGVVAARVVVAAALLLAGTAHAQSSENTERAAARKLGYAGVEAFQAENYAAASEKLEKAYAVLRVPSLGLWSARALVKQGKLVEAVNRYSEIAGLTNTGADAGAQRDAQADALSELGTTQALIPSLAIRIEGAQPSTVELTVDGARVSSQLAGEAMPLNPGPHTITASSGAARATAQVTLAPKDQKDVLLRLEAPAKTSAPALSVVDGSTPATDSSASRPSSTRRTLGWVLVGGGAAGLVVGGVTGGLALSKRSKLDENPSCKDDHSCPPSLQGDVDSLNQMRHVSTIAFIAGGALAAAGAVVLITTPKATATSTALLVSPTGISLKGAF